MIRQSLKKFHSKTQNTKIRMQNDKEKFKKNFIERLIKFSIAIIKFSESQRKQKIRWCLTDQLIRSATSIGANVVEAKASSSRKEYINFFQIALKSANETVYWLLIFKELKTTDRDQLEKLFDEVNEIAKIIASSVLTLKGKK
ncbi:four helix bundle protein [bacterium]|nr:MAG: four helix bundle protein [bacterium]